MLVYADGVGGRTFSGAEMIDPDDGAIDWIDFSGVGAVTADLGRGTARLTGGGADDYLAYIENARGSDFGDTITGGWAGSVIEGGRGADVILGRDGDDRLVGGAAADRVTGGGGADRFVFEALGDFARGAVLDRILDFARAEGDRIDLSAIDPDAGAAGDQKFTFIGGAAFSGGAAYELRVSGSVAAGFLVEGDADRDGAADVAFVVMSGVGLVKGDFVL